jgi:hypothetical protein
MPKLLRVQATEGSAVVFPRSVLPGAGAKPYVLRSGDPPVDVPDDPFVRRRLKSGGGLELVPQPSAAPAARNMRAPRSPDLAAPAASTTAKE